MTPYSVFEFENTLVLWWHERMAPAGVEECVRLGERMMSRDRIAFLTIIDSLVDLNAPAEGRRAMANFLSRNEQQISAAAMIYPAGGFKATAVRSLMTAINLASRTKFPNRVFSETLEAIRWMTSVAGAPPAAADRLIRVCETRKQRLAS